MKLTIDTQQDSYEDIKKVLHILTSIIQQKEGNVQSNYTDSGNPDTANLMSMFDDTPAQKTVPDTPPNFGSFLNLTKKPEELKKERPTIEFY